MLVRGKFVKLMSPLDGEELGSGDGGSEFDFEGAGEELSNDLFGTPAGSDDGGEVAVAEPAVDDPAPTDPPSTEAPATPATSAPKTWRPEAAAKFATLPPEVQQEVLKREEDIFKGLEAYKADATVGKTFKSLIQPYENLFQSQGVDPLQQVNGLLRAHVALSTGTPEQKQQFFQQVAREYGVELSGEAPYIDPQVAGLQKQLSDLQSRLNGREQQELAQARTKLQAEIDSFASDPAHQYFDEVANDIAGLLRSGAATNLQDAYDKAIWANPATRAKEQSRLAAEAEAKAKADAAERVKQARKATGANVKSSAKAASGTAPLGSIDDTLNAVLANIKARA